MVDLESLGTQARALLAGFFPTPRHTLRIGNERSHLTDDARKAIDELIRVGLIRAEHKEVGPAVSYSRTEADDRHFTEKLEWMKEHAQFPITKPLIAQQEADNE